MTVEEKLRQEIELISDGNKLRDIIISLSGMLLTDIKSISKELIKLKKQIKTEETIENAAHVRFISLLLTLLITQKEATK